MPLRREGTKGAQRFLSRGAAGSRTPTFRILVVLDWGMLILALYDILAVCMMRGDLARTQILLAILLRVLPRMQRDLPQILILLLILLRELPQM